MGKRKLVTLLLALMCVIFIVQCQQWYEKGNPHFINEELYDKLVKNPQTREKGTIVLKFFTPWCRYCRYLKDIIDNLRAQQSLSIKIYEVNCDGENHNFCVNMGVRSYPKMMVFVDGQFKETMDGFYPHHVVKELFLKYNQPIQSEEQQHEIEKEDGHQQGHNQASSEHSQKHKKNKRHKKPHKKQNREEHKVEHQEVKKQEQHKEQDQEQQKTAKQSIKNNIHQQPKQVPSHSQKDQPQKLNKDSEPEANFIEPQVVQSQKIQQSPPINPQMINSKLKKKDNYVQKSKSANDKSEKSAKKITDSQEVQIKPHQPPQHKIKQQSQPAIEQQQDMVIMEGYKEVTQQQKRIVDSIKKNSQQKKVIDATKLLSDHLESHDYGKYLLYIVSIIVGGYYFLQIMKAQPDRQEEEKNTITIQHSNLNPNDSLYPQSVLSDKIHLHPNEEEQRINHIQIRDEDL